MPQGSSFSSFAPTCRKAGPTLRARVPARFNGVSILLSSIGSNASRTSVNTCRTCSADSWDKLESKIANAGSDPRLQMLAGPLRLAGKNSIPAPNISFDRVNAALLVTQPDAVFFAGVPAIRMIRSVRKEATEDTMLRMKYRQVMKTYHFNPPRFDSFSQTPNLFRIQIVSRRNPLQTHIQICFCRNRVGNVEAEIRCPTTTFCRTFLIGDLKHVIEQAARPDENLAVQ